MLARYKPSGRTSIRILPALVLAVIAGAALAWPYQKLISWVPFIYINAIVYLAFAFGIGMLVKLACSKGHNRNRFLGALFGMVVATSAIATSHYVMYRSVFNDAIEEVKKDSDMAGIDIEALAEKELTFSKYVDLRVDTGWSLGRHSSSSSDAKGDIVGPLVWLVWGIEALGLLIAGLFFGIRGTPYCEACKKDLPEQDLMTRTDLDLADLGAITAAPAVQTLVDLPPKNQPSTVGLRVTYAVHACTSCEGDTYLTIKSAFPAGDKTEEKTLHREVVLPRTDYNRLLALREQIAQSGVVAL